MQMLSNLTILGVTTNKTDRIGVKLRKVGLRPKHPVVIVPGTQLGIGHSSPNVCSLVEELGLWSTR